MEWINLKEQAPPFDETVLVFRQWESGKDRKKETLYGTGRLIETSIRKTSNGVQHSHEFHVGDNYDVRDVTHWAKLEPPKS